MTVTEDHPLSESLHVVAWTDIDMALDCDGDTIETFTKAWQRKKIPLVFFFTTAIS